MHTHTRTLHFIYYIDSCTDILLLLYTSCTDGLYFSEPLVTHEASGVPIGSKNEFDLKHYINDFSEHPLSQNTDHDNQHKGMCPRIHHLITTCDCRVQWDFNFDFL